MKMRTLQTAVGALIAFTVLAGCGESDATPLAVRGARDAAEALPLLVTGMPRASRPSAPLGVFASLYLSHFGILPVRGAIAGVHAETILSEEAPINIDETFALLQEYGTILSVSVPDLLNQSTDRVQALNAYVQGLQNITVRAKKLEGELKVHIDRKRDDEREAQKRVTEIQRTIDKGFRDRDYSVAGSEQQALVDAQKKLTEVHAEVERGQNVLRTLQQLIDIATRRLAAIDKNREALIAGIAVTDIPGIEELDILRKGRSGGGIGGEGAGSFNFTDVLNGNF
jgi:hypothetical protein